MQEVKGFKKPIYVTKSFLPPIEEYEKEIEKIWESHWLTNNGPLHNELEKQLETYLKVKNIILFTNGHLALDIAIKALRLKGEVITTPFTFASTTHAIVMNGLKPVFCDISLRDFNMDVSQIENLITEKTSAIIPVHVFGNPCNVMEIEQIAKKHHLKVIYDAAHATGVEIGSQGIGSFGDASMFSFHATKVYNTIEGGALAFNNDSLKQELQKYKNFGITGPESVEKVGINAKMNEFQAAMGLINLKHLDEQIQKRKIIWQIYYNELSQVQGIYIPSFKQYVKPNYSYCPILIDERKCACSRDEMYTKLQEYNVFTRKYFYPLTTDFECYKNQYQTEHLKVAKYVADRILTLPIYGDLLPEEAFHIAQIIKHIMLKG